MNDWRREERQHARMRAGGDKSRAALKKFDVLVNAVRIERPPEARSGWTTATGVSGADDLLQCAADCVRLDANNACRPPRRAAPRRAADVAVLASHPRFATQPRTAHLLA